MMLASVDCDKMQLMHYLTGTLPTPIVPSQLQISDTCYFFYFQWTLMMLSQFTPPEDVTLFLVLDAQNQESQGCSIFLYEAL